MCTIYYYTTVTAVGLQTNKDALNAFECPAL